MAWKNGLRLCDLLEGLVQQQQQQQQPGSGVSATHPFRSATKSLQIAVQDVQLQFVEPDDLFTPRTDGDSQSMLQQYAALQPQDGNIAQELELLEDQIDNLLQQEDGRANGGGDDGNRHYNTVGIEERRQHFEQVAKDAFALTSPTNIPWLRRFRLALDSTTDQLPHCLLQAPPVVLLVATTSENSMSVLETVQNLASTHYLPVGYHNGLLDASLARQHVWVLHDNIDGPSSDQWNESQLRQQLQSSFGASSSAIIRVNSLSRETAQQLAREENSDLWDGGGTRGSCLSVSDRVLLRKHLQTLVTSTLLPAMERRIADLNAVVQEKKRGVKNVLKSLWGGGGGSSSNKSGDNGGNSPVSATGANVLYRYDTVESQALLLADSLFLMQDYEAALSIYKLVRDDFKHDKAHMYYGGVQEMMALCMYLTDPYGRSRDIFSSIENALLSYARAAEDERPMSWGEKPGRPATAPKATRLATRLCLVLMSTRNICEERHLEVADLLASASSHETSLGAAVLLEQSSAHYFFAELYRKYAFHMLMSGHMFRSAEQEQHAFRCFASALYIYRDSRWEELHNHLRSALAAQLYGMGRMATSLQLYAKLVGTTEGGRVSSKSQQKFVNHLLEICNEHPKKALVGADRMAASAKLSGELRDKVRKERLERIVQVVRYTKSASRVLELPNVDLPGIDDSTVVVLADESTSAASASDWIPSFGDAQRGSDKVWEELMLATTAELMANDLRLKSMSSEDASSSAPARLAKIEDVMIRSVVEQIDKEKANRNIKERSKRSANYKEQPPVRALMEPLEVEFSISNPLAIPIDLSDLQIVARMTSEDDASSSNQVCTNEDAIKITPLASFDRKSEWTFHGSQVKFFVPDFCRLSDGEKKDPLKQAWKSAEEVEPFFVVTKMSLSLESESRRTVSVSICPLRRGNLEIVGVRCRLLDDVWVFHPFDLQGPLLQNTRANRANRVRAEPMILKAKVERGMPCLSCELVRSSENEDAGGPTLQGQVGYWILRLSNVGTASATNVFLKTNYPWIDVVDDAGRGTLYEELEDEPLHCCIGPTGTLIQIPVQGKDLNSQGEIQPGETVDVPIRIRASESGRHEFYMLFRYELVQEDTSTNSPRYRYLKKMFEVPVYPSISLSASIMPSFSSHSDHILSVEFTNNRTDRPDKLDLVINKLSLASRCYRLEALPGQFGGKDGAKLGWQERITAHYRITAEEATDCCFLTECSFEDNDENATGPVNDALSPCSSSLLNFACLERAHDQFETTLKSHQLALVRAAASQGQEGQHPRSIAQIRRSNTSALTGSSRRGGTEGGSHPTSVARLCPRDSGEESVCLVCTWKGEDGKISGEHYVRDLPVRPSAKSSAGCPLTITAKHPQIVSVPDFSTGPVDVPFEITLRNRLVSKDPVDFVVTIERPDGDEFDFAGPESFKSSLGGGEELAFPLRALVPSAGVYNLQKVRLTVDGDSGGGGGDEPQISYVFPMQWLCTVTEQ